MQSIADAMESFQEISGAVLAELVHWLAPCAEVLPDQRFAATLFELAPGLLAARTPQIAPAAAGAPRRGVKSWSQAKCGYRLMDTPRFSHRDWLKVLYSDARRVAQAAQIDLVIVALDPVNFENAYTTKLEGVSTIWKSTPPGSLPERRARITPGYPALLAYSVNLPQPTIPYARLFSYKAPDFDSENKEIFRGLRTIRAILCDQKVCIVTDAGFDDRKFYACCAKHALHFITRAAKDRLIDVYNPRLKRWEREHLKEMVASMPGQASFPTILSHAGQSYPMQVTLDWFRCRLPDSSQDLWVTVAETDHFPDPLVLITDRTVEDMRSAQGVYQDWCLRPGIEHLYRFIQEDGLDIEKIMLRNLEGRRRLFVLILMLALFVLRLPDMWTPASVHWLRSLASSTAGTAMDRSGPYLLLRGLQYLFITQAVLSALAHGPPPPIFSKPQLDQSSYG
jgi:hypothetical protein